MKKLITVLLAIMPLFVLSQKLHYGSGGIIYDDKNKKITSDDVKILFRGKDKALALYDHGRNKKTFSNFLFYGGLAMITTNAIVAGNTGNFVTTTSSTGVETVTTKSPSIALAVIGAVLVVVSVPVKIGYPKKIKLSIDNYNQELADTYKPTQKLTFIASNEQLGFRFEF